MVNKSNHLIGKVHGEPALGDADAFDRKDRHFVSVRVHVQFRHFDPCINDTVGFWALLTGWEKILMLAVCEEVIILYTGKLLVQSWLLDSELFGGFVESGKLLTKVGRPILITQKVSIFF